MNTNSTTASAPAGDGDPQAKELAQLKAIQGELEHLIRTGEWTRVMAIAHAKLTKSRETRIAYNTQNLAEAAIVKMRNAKLGKVASDKLREKLADSDTKEAKKAQASLHRAYEALAYLGSLPLLDETQASEAKTMVAGDATASRSGCLTYLRRAMLSVLNDARRKRAAEGRRAEDFAEAEQAEFLADSIGDLLPADIRASDRATKGRAIAAFLREFYDAHPSEAACLLAYGAMKHGKRGVNVDAPEIEVIYEQLAGAGIGRWDTERRVYHGLDTVEELAVAFGKAQAEDEPGTRRKAGQRLVAKAQTLLDPFLRVRGILPSPA